MFTVSHDKIMSWVLKKDEDKIAHIEYASWLVKQKDYDTAKALLKHVVKSL